MSLRICRLVPALPSDDNPGAGLVFHYLAQHIPEPALYIARHHPGLRPLPPNVELVAVRFREATTPAWLRPVLFATGQPRLLPRAAAQALLTARVLGSESRFLLVALWRMARFRPSVVVCHSLKRLVPGLAAKCLLRTKLVLALHNTTETVALGNLRLLRLLVRIPDRVIVVSPEIGRQLRRFVPEDRIRISSTGVDLTAFTNWNRPRANQLVAIGAFKWKKGYRHLLEAAALVLRRFPDHRLLIVGDGEERPAILDSIDRLGLAGRIVLTGTLGRAAIIRVLNESKLLVMASLHEGLPKVLLEALACGTPAVVTDACNAEGLIERTGLSVPAADPPALADAIATVLGDEGLWEKCSRNGPEVARDYDWRAVAARDYAVYRELVRADS